MADRGTAAAATVAGIPGPPVRKREIFGWAMFDFANSSYTTVVVSVVYGKFFVNQIVPEGSAARHSYWSLAIGLSTVLALVLSPLAGAICDYSGRKKTYLLGSALVCAASTSMLAFVSPGMVWTAIILLIVSNAGFMLSETFIASFLPELSTPDTMGRISGLGWGIGYFGGLASVILCARLIITSNPADDPIGYVDQNQMAMAVTGLFFLLAAMPTFLLVRNRTRPMPGYEGAGPIRLLKAGLREFTSTFETARRNKILFQFFGAFMVYIAGLDAIVKFVGIYAEEAIRLTTGEIAALFIILQLSAAAGAFGFGMLERRLGPKKTVMLTLFWWIAGVAAISFLDSIALLFGTSPKTIFSVLAFVTGAGIGATQASSRTIVGLLAPPGQTAQMFGFWGTALRFGTLLGLLFGPVSDAFGSPRAGVFLVLAFFVVGAAMLSRVDIVRGIREARAVP